MKKMRKICVLGYFADTTQRVDGQIAKTREIYKLFSMNIEKGWKLDRFDTELLKYGKWNTFILIYKLLTSNILIYLPGQKNLMRLGGIIYIISLLRNISVVYIVIGGWLVDFLNNNPFLIKIVKSFRAIMVENQEVLNGLKENFNLTNVVLLPNFRIHNFIPDIVSKETHRLKLVFMSRILIDKGIDVAFSIADELNKLRMSDYVQITFYGPMSKLEYEKSFFQENLHKFPNVSYGGVLQMNEIHSVLSQYDVMLFPTHYEGEGFPGAILDAFISGIPVIASNWKYNSEIVETGYNGFICYHNSIHEYLDVIKILLNDSNRLLQLKYNAYESSKKYSYDVIWHNLIGVLNNVM